MKIIQVPRRFVSHAWGGTETVILNTCRALKAAGHTTPLFTSMALSKLRHETIQGIDVHRFPYVYPFFGLSPAAKEELDRKGGNLLSFSLFWQLLREPDVHLLHAHSGKRLGGMVRTAARMRGIPYVITLHGGVYEVPQHEQDLMVAPLKKTLEWGKPFGLILGSRRVLMDAAAVICVGRNEADAVQKALPGQRVEFLPNGVDSQWFATGDGPGFRRRFGIAEEKRIILCVSRIDYQKNQMALVEALPTILTQQPNAHLLMIGPVTIESYHQQLVSRIQKLGLSQQTTLIPGLPPGDTLLRDAYHAADLFCLSSLHEPFGIVILEAWSSGVPVAAANVGGVPSFTRHEHDLLHLDPTRPDDIARTLIRLFKEPETAQRLALAGRKTAQEVYDWSHVSQSLLSIYQDVVNAT